MLMCILLLQMKPYFLRKHNYSELLNEGAIILVIYHMILLSDFVPMHLKTFRNMVGLSMIAVILITVFLFLVLILQAIALKVWKSRKKAFLKVMKSRRNEQI